MATCLRTAEVAAVAFFHVSNLWNNSLEHPQVTWGCQMIAHSVLQLLPPCPIISSLLFAFGGFNEMENKAEEETEKSSEESAGYDNQ